MWPDAEHAENHWVSLDVKGMAASWILARLVSILKASWSSCRRLEANGNRLDPSWKRRRSVAEPVGGVLEASSSVLEASWKRLESDVAQR